MINECRLEGILRDAAVIPRRDQSKTPGRRFTIAVPNGSVHDFYSVTAWDEAAISASQFNDGDRVVVSGRLGVAFWKSGNGESKRRVGIVAHSITGAGETNA